MNHVTCTCGATFTQNPIVSLLEHREREHSVVPVRYYSLAPEKPLAPNPAPYAAYLQMHRDANRRRANRAVAS